ncbi:hypothetical protein CUMW_055480 [Citrus unshiu]|nr:hypothetical protein CUMW_055480 [Citrus unshiu]
MVLRDGHDSEDPKQSTADMTVFGLIDFFASLICAKSSSTDAVQASCLLNFNVLDEMGNRINELEQSINDLRAEMGVEGSPSPLTPSKTNSAYYLNFDAFAKLEKVLDNPIELGCNLTNEKGMKEIKDKLSYGTE